MFNKVTLYTLILS